jgi:D-xylose transport system permease protein
MRGERSYLPVLLGLAAISVIFQAVNASFLSPLNLTNLASQVVPVGIIALGITLVLMIAEIDLSAGATSGFAAAVMAVLVTQHGIPVGFAIAIGVLVGAAVGLAQGLWIIRIGVPSFLVTLAGFIIWQGALLSVLGSTGTVNLNDPLVIGLANQRLPIWLGWILGLSAAAVYVVGAIRRDSRGYRASETHLFLRKCLFHIGLLGLPALGAVCIMSVNRSPNPEVVVQGVPFGVCIFVALVIVVDFILRRTQLGRHILAVGGNTEAARRAGIEVARIRLIVFVIASSLAAFGGIMAAARLYAVNQASGSGDLLLNAIAAAVIGGTSLFGGRGTAWAALLGALMIGAISNGMDLLALASPIKFMLTGSVLLIAVTVDAAVSRREEWLRN